MPWKQYPLTINKTLPVIEPGKPVYIDIETNGLNPFRPDAKIHCLSLSQNPDIVNWVRLTKENRQSIKDILINNGVMAHRGTFEGTWIRRKFGVLLKLYFDTKLGAFMMDENEETGLKHQAVMHLKCEPWGSEDIDFDEVNDWEKMAEYNSKDSGHGLRLYQNIQLPHLKKHPKQARLLKYILLPAQEVFIDVICRGFHINEESATQKLEQCDEEMARFNERINEVAGYAINPGSPKQMVRLLYQELGLRCPVKTKKGTDSSSEAALIRLAGKHEVLDYILEWRKWKKYSSTYLGPWLEKGPILHPNYGFTNTDTGRLNSTMTKNKRREKRGGATLHQCPRDKFIRNLITPRGYAHDLTVKQQPEPVPDDWCILEADLSQIELRLVAHAANERTMMEIFNNDEDIHIATAATLKRGEIDDETRKKAKAVNFGFVYGMWPPKFVAYAKEKFGLDLTKQEGERYREQFFDKYQDLPMWYSRVESFVSNNGWVDSIFGRRRHLPDAKFDSGLDDWIRREAVRQAINSPIQGAGSDLNLFIAALMSSLSLRWKFKIDEKKAFMVGSAHDSQIYECRRDYAKELREGINYTVSNLPVSEYFGFDFKVPIKMDVKAYSDCWKGKPLAI